MRVVIVWAVALSILLTISIGWYVTLSVAFGISAAIESQVASLPIALQVLHIVEYVVILWGPIWDGLIILWAFMESHRIDITSTTYGG